MAVHTSDIELDQADISGLSSPDAVAAFFARLGYRTSVREELTAESLGLTGETADAIRGMELLAEDDDGFLRVVFAKLRSITAKARNDLARNLGKRNVDHLVILASDFDVIEFVLIDKRTRQQAAPGGAGTRVQIIPRTLSVVRKASTQLDRRILRRLTWTGKDGLDQFDKLRSVFEAAAYTGRYFQNRALFADHYLETRLREDAAWSESPASAFMAAKDVLTDARRRWAGKPEQTLRDELYDPVWKLLGFKAKVNKPAAKDHLEPDYVLKSKDGTALTVAFTYRWDRWLDGPDLHDPDTPDENPGAAVVTTLNRGDVRWVIVTNGKLWRLYSRDAHSRSTNFYEVDLEEALLASGETDPNEAFRYWWLFFRAQASQPTTQAGDGAVTAPSCWLDQVVQGSRDYAKGLGERLKDRIFVEIFPHLSQGFLADRRHRLGLTKPPTDAELREVFEATLTLLYRILFLLYAEARDLLPVRESSYHESSFKRMKEQIAEGAGIAEGQVADHLTKAYKTDETKLYDRLAKLFWYMDHGDSIRNLPCYHGGLFITEPDKQSDAREQRIARFLLEHKVPDRCLAIAIDRLARDPDDKTCGLVFIDYKSLEVRHLGSIYEGLLEFRLKVAEEDLATATEKKKEKYIPLSQAKARRGKNGPEAVVRKGQVYLSNDKAERKATGSYYTPDPIVKYIVEHTVGPVLNERLKALRDDFRKAGKTYQRHLSNARSNKGLVGQKDPRVFAAEKTYAEHKDLVDRLFEFRVLDPAMGSGHFLVEAVDFVTDRVLDFLNGFPANPVSFALERTRTSILEALTAQSVTIDPDKLTDVHLLKRHILKRCIYGVDLNPMAVELAKVSLWLDAFTLGAPLSFLDHHLRWGNTLVGEQDIREHVLPGSARAEELCRTVHNIMQIAASADANAADVETSKALFAEAERVIRPFKNRLHVETGVFFVNVDGPTRQRMISYPYDAAFDPTKPPKNAERSHAAYLQVLRLADEQRFFHWELEFPEVYFAVADNASPRDEDRQSLFDRRAARAAKPIHLPDTREQVIRHRDAIINGSAGFDAIVGNPPYVRQEAIKPFKPFFKARYQTYDSTNDLYVYFQEQEVRNLKVGGRMGMIVANKWMRAGYGERLRGFLQRKAQPLQVVDFGHAPIFPDADTFPCIPIVSRRPKPIGDGDALPDEEQMDVCSVPREHWDERMDLVTYVQARRSAIPTRLLRDEGWSLEDPRVQHLLDKIRNTGVALKDFCGDIPYRGPVTGLNEAFIIDSATRDSLIRADKRSGDIVKPILRGRDIDRWRPRPSSSYLIVARRGIAINSYPAIKNHLQGFRERLEPKPAGCTDRKKIGRAPGDYAWYELQASPGDDLLDVFTSPKIVYQDLAFHSRFALEADGVLINDLCFALPCVDPYVLAVLNSSLTWWVLSRTVIHGKDEVLRLKGIYMEVVPVPVATHAITSAVQRLVDKIQKETTRRIDWECETLGTFSRLIGIDFEPELFDWLALDPDVLVRRVTSRMDGTRMSEAMKSGLVKHGETGRRRQLELLSRQLELEKQLAALVEDAYGLTADERALLRATRPVRDPIDVLEGKIRGGAADAEAAIAD